MNTCPPENTGRSPVKAKVIGVMDNYHQSDLRSLVKPMLLMPAFGWEDKLAVRVQGGQIPATVSAISAKWEVFFPNQPFDYGFLEKDFAQTYRREEKTGRIFGIFAGLAIFISCLGLFSLAAFAAERRTREIGIRKVLGASLGNIFTLLSREFIYLVLMAFGLSVPIAWIITQKWLQNFAYQADIGLGLFLTVGVLALLIALLTIAYQSWRAAGLNPVEILRDE
ncbi:MAG: FtsX-like permease family protein [Bacteroidia bacterium]|nr:FtsX-like permease family protein [Bacteroidia bacterium]